MANPEHVELVKQGAEAIAKWREENPHTRLDLRDVDWHNADLHEADLFGADLRGADLTSANLVRARLFVADLRGAQLRVAALHKADLAGARLEGADLLRARLTGAHVRSVRGAYWANYLETVAFEGIEGIPPEDAHGFETCKRSWPERWFDWERLRIMGRLPLFGISYTTLIFILTAFYGLALYNEKIDLVQAWAQQAVTSPDHPLYRLAPLILDRLHRLSIPRLSFVLLLSTILLAAGSTLYTLFCPSRIKKFSRDQWCDQLGRSLLHYWPLARMIQKNRCAAVIKSQHSF